MEEITESADELYNEAPCGYLSADQNGFIDKINDTLLNWLGYKREELVGKIAWQKLLSIGGKIYHQTHFIPLLHANNIIEEVNFEFKMKNGEKLPVIINANSKQNDAGKFISFRIIVLRFTQRKSYELEILKAKKTSELASKTKSDFLANMSHEIRTPLNGVIGFTDLVLGTNLDETQSKYMKIVSQSANSLLDLLNDILDFSKIEAGKLEIHIEKMDIRSLLEEASNIIQFKVDEKKLRLILTFPKNLPRFIFSDPIRLRQILINLLGNAIKFTAKGEIEMSLEIKDFFPETNEMIFLFSVRDTGIGISIENQNKIFEAFSQADSTTTRKYGGTGLGLSISNKLLALMNTKLDLESELDKGSRFHFPLKVKIENDSMRLEENFLNAETKILLSREDSKNESLLDSEISKNLKILIVDDIEINLSLLKNVLSKLTKDAIFIEARDGFQAVEQYKQEKPDFVFMDIQMPNLNGYEATIEIRKLETDKRVPIIALTAGTVREEINQCFESGMDDYGSKPIKKEILKALLLKWQPSNLK